jgi:hypothetical protein
MREIFVRCEFKELDFAGAGFAKSEFQSCTFKDVNFSDCDLDDAKFVDSKFEGGLEMDSVIGKRIWVGRKENMQEIIGSDNICSYFKNVFQKK